MPSVPQHEILRRGIHAAGLIRERPRGLADLVSELALPQRGVERVLAGLRAAGLRVVSYREPSDRRWYYAIRDPLPPWLTRAVRALALSGQPEK
jgi:hypothetical protein